MHVAIVQEIVSDPIHNTTRNRIVTASVNVEKMKRLACGKMRQRIKARPGMMAENTDYIVAVFNSRGRLSKAVKFTDLVVEAGGRIRDGRIREIDIPY